MRRLIAAVLVVLTGCSSGTKPHAEAPTTTSASTATTPPTHATTTPQTTITTTTTTTTSTTTTTVALPPPTEVTIPAGDLTAGQRAEAEFRAAVENDWRQGRWLYLTAQADPTNQQAVDAALSYTTRAVRDRHGPYFESLATTGQYGIPNSLVPDQLVITDGPHQVDGQPDVATLSYCRINSTIMMEHQPDGADIIINDDIIRQDWNAAFWWNGEIWQLGSLELTDQTLGATSCDGS